MTKVIKATCSGGDSYAQKNLTLPSAWYVQADLAVPAATLSALQGATDANTASLFMVEVPVGADDGPFLGDATNLTSLDSPTAFWSSENGATGAVPSVFPSDQFNTVVFHYDGTDMHVTVNGSAMFSYPETIASGSHYLRVGGLQAFGVAGEVYYATNVKVGTTLGGVDIFQDDFSSGDFSAWDSTSGSVLVEDNPFVPPMPTVGEGVSISFGDTALETDPTWVRIDNVKGVNVSSIQVKRGRPDARSKTSVGTVSLNGFDLVGDTDPTNATGPWFGTLDPCKQAQVCLFNPIASAWSPIFTGYTSDWTHVLDVSEKKLDFTLDLVDMLDMLNDAEIVPDKAGNLVPGESKGDVFYTGQHVDDRIIAVIADSPTALLNQAWPDVLLEGDGGEVASGNVFVQGRTYAARTTLLQVIDEACDAEGPGFTNRFITWDGVFAFRGRYYRYKVENFIPSDGIRVSGQRCLEWFVGDHPAAEIDPTLAIYTGLTFTRGKTNLINASLVTPLGIAQNDIAGQFVSDPTSVSLYGPRTEGTSYEDVITGDADDGNNPFQETKSFGQAIVDNYKDPVTRVSQITFRNPPAGASDARAAATWDLLCNVELSDLVTITSTHPGGGGFVADKHFVEGITYQINPLRGDEWDVTLTLDLSPRSYFDVIPSSWNPPS